MAFSLKWRPWALWGCAVGLAQIAACSPTFNWREVRLEGAPLVALMPCKPEQASREVPLLGQATALHMHSCKAGDLTFAVAWADLPGQDNVEAALMQWKEATLAAVRAQEGTPSSQGERPQAWDIPGAQSLQRLQADGRDHQGQPMQVKAAFFGRGLQVYQAAVYGRQIEEAVSLAFFEGLTLP